MVLGAVRIFQPAHGYFIRRELLTWGVEQWANVNPGSIYNALRTLTREGYLTETPAEKARGGGQSRTTYQLTVDGNTHFLTLLRRSIWQPDQYDTSNLLGGLSFMHFLTRDEVISAMEARAGALRNILSESQHSMRSAEETRVIPAQTFELWFVSHERLKGELTWSEQLVGRLRQGYYRFTPEPGWDTGPAPDGTWPGPLDKADAIQT